MEKDGRRWKKGDIFCPNCLTIEMNATVGDGYTPLGPSLLLWENCMGKGQTDKQTRYGHLDYQTKAAKKPIRWQKKEEDKSAVQCSMKFEADATAYCPKFVWDGKQPSKI